MWGLLTTMVSTRRSSARLQEKQESVPSSPAAATDSAQASPATRTRRAARKETPPSATRTSSRRTTPTKTTAKRGRPARGAAAASHSDSDGNTVTESDATSEQTDHDEVKKQLFVEEQTENESTPAPTATADEPQQEPEVIVEVAEVAVVEHAPETTEEQDEEQIAVPVAEDTPVNGADEATEEEEEEEIVMMDDSEHEDDEEHAANDGAEAQEGDDMDEDDDVDILEYAKMAATGISLSASTSSSQATATSAKSSTKLVPDSLDSGASQRTKFLHFEGSKLGQGAKILSDTAAAEEQQVLARQLGKVAKANRQRDEATQDASAGRKWFGMQSQAMDADARRDFALLRMRNYLDPKKFYKSSDHSKKMPSHFQFGTVIEGAHEFKSARLTKKERQQTFTDEIMADDSVRKYTKRVFLQVQAAKAGQGKKKKQKRF